MNKLLTIRESNISGKGVFAVEDIEKDKSLGIAFTKVSDTGDEDVDYTRTELGAFVNHSTDDNLILIKDNDTFIYVTKCKILKDSELLFNYENFPWEGKRNF
jgi:hypothetical protein